MIVARADPDLLRRRAVPRAAGRRRVGRFGRILIGLGLILFALQWIRVAAQPIVGAAGVKVLFASLTGDVMLDMLVGALVTILVLLEPRGRAAGRRRSRSSASSAPRSPSAWCWARTSAAALLGDAVDAALAARGAPRDARQLPVQADRRRSSRSRSCNPLLRLVESCDARPRPGSRRCSTCCSTSFIALAFIFFTEQDRARRRAPAADAAAHREPTREPRHLDPSALETPTLAIGNAAREAMRIADTIEQMLTRHADGAEDQRPRRSPASCATWTTPSTRSTRRSSST